MIFSRFNDYNIACLDWIIGAIDREDSYALNEDKHLVHIMDMLRFRVGGFSWFEHINAAACYSRGAERLRNESVPVWFQIENGKPLH